MDFLFIRLFRWGKENGYRGFERPGVQMSMRRIGYFLAIAALVSAYLAAHLLLNKRSRSKIYYYDNAQTELISPNGTRILIDVFNPSKLSRPVSETDILLTTHMDNDHYHAAFAKSFPGKQLCTRSGDIKVLDVVIKGIPAVYRPDDKPQEVNGSNYIFLVEINGFRIVHCGEVGQDTFTDEQRAILGNVDIAITQFDNPYSLMDENNKKGLKLMDQLKPKLIIPTHNSAKLVDLEGEKWKSMYSEKKFVSIGPRDLTNETRILFLGVLAQTWAKRTHAAKASW